MFFSRRGMIHVAGLILSQDVLHSRCEERWGFGQDIVLVLVRLISLPGKVIVSMSRDRHTNSIWEWLFFH
jgi:hypothetical protein